MTVHSQSIGKRLIWLSLMMVLKMSDSDGALAARSTFTPLTALPAPRAVTHTEQYPGDRYSVEHLFDGNRETEYASHDKGTNTIVEMEFASTVTIAAFRHVDRRDRATVAASELMFFDAEGKAIGTVEVAHANVPAGETFYVLDTPISAKRVRWRVTKVGSEFVAVGGAEMTFFATAKSEPTPVRDRIQTLVLPFIEKDGRQPIRVTIDHFYAEPADAVLSVQGAEPKPLHLKPGVNVIEWTLAAVPEEKNVQVELLVGEKTVAQTQFRQKPVMPLKIYVLAHSHTDIGYTEIQTAIEKKQVNNLLDGIAQARRTANYPEGARFVWNVEVLWAADLYLHRLDDQQRGAFLDAVKKGQVVLNGMYLNELTGLCRPEELVRLFREGTKLGEQTGVPIDAAMISDVPGYTWGTVTALSSAGIKYFSVAPNYFDRIGNILVEWENKPFYWVGPDGKTKVLTWIPYQGYATSHRYGSMSPQLVQDIVSDLERRGYPSGDIAYIRWSGHGDNAVPDASICDFVKDWNSKYQWPRFIISGTSEAFRALEQRYGDKIPQVGGDWTPYWEDGAGSSARETAMNRHSSDRLSQAEALFAMRRPTEFPAAAFEGAWRNVLLYSEHTWGADCSISEPDSKKTREQWEIKRSYADHADEQSRGLLASAGQAAPSSNPIAGAVDVINTTSWPRSELVYVSAELSIAGDRVNDDAGNPVPSQRLTSGQLVFLAEAIPPFAARRFTTSAGPPHVAGTAVAQGNVLDNGRLRVRIDEKTGGIVELTAVGIDGSFADTSGGEAINDYLYLRGDDLKDLRRNGPVTIHIGEKGPLVASLVIESDAPGCKKLIREVRAVAGADHVELHNLVDKVRLEAKSYHAKEGKESVNFAFPFDVHDGQMLLDIPLAVMRPQTDQIPGACKNWFTVGRWIDVSNAERGITCVTLDASLVQVGGITATLLNSQTDPSVWRRAVPQTQKFYAWVMNNHWGTNYRAYQEGPTLFRFILRPHRQRDPAEAARFAIGFSQPLLVVPARAAAPISAPLLRVEPSDVLVTTLKPSDDGRGWIVRLFAANGESRRCTLTWTDLKPSSIWMSDTSEKRGNRVLDGVIDVPAWGLVTVRIER